MATVGPSDTIWQPNKQEGEFTNGTVNDIADSTNRQLVDNSGNNIVDSGTTFTATPLTVWAINDIG